MCAGLQLRKPINSQDKDYKAGCEGPGPGQESRGSRPNLPANRWLPDHTQQSACQPCWNGVAAHGGVGEAAQAEEDMIVIEYEMSITWNELAIQVGKGADDWFSHLPEEHEF